MNKLKIRRLTPKEYYRLMGFDDKDFEKAAQVNSNTQLYKQAGNSIVVNVLEAILRNLLLEPVDSQLEGQTNIYDYL
jgi:DNA (cytosine-5)-methyltransferase 1